MDFVLKLVFLMLLLSPSSQNDAKTEPFYMRFNWWAKRDTEDTQKANNDTENLGKILDAGRHSDNSYSYSECDGPANWHDEYPSCNGVRQSPININLPATYQLGKQYNLVFKRHDVLPDSMTLKNTGKTVVLKASWNNGKKPTIWGGILDGEFVFHEIHFHWGATQFEPSDHLINGYSFPLEMHLVYYKKAYGSIKNAKDYSDGLAVIAYVFKVGDDDNAVLQNIIEKLSDIQNPDDSPADLTPFKISKLAPMFTRDFVTYLGSLTMPPCSEIVTWIVYLKPLKASCDQVDQFKLIQDQDGNAIERNFRPVQRLNDRKVFLVSKYHFH